MPASAPPPSSVIPGKSGGNPYLIGVLVLGALIAALVVWKLRGSTPTETTSAQNTLRTAPTQAEPQSLEAPPPPPKLDEEDAGAAAKPSTAGNGKSPCSAKCEGQSSGALDSALRSAAASAQGCYNRALRTTEVSGKLTVSVQVGTNGSVCGASIVSDSVNSGEIASCVLGKFRGRSFPAPSGGCIVANIPIAFTIKQ